MLRYIALIGAFCLGMVSTQAHATLTVKDYLEAQADEHNKKIVGMYVLGVVDGLTLMNGINVQLGGGKAIFCGLETIANRPDFINILNTYIAKVPEKAPPYNPSDPHSDPLQIDRDLIPLDIAVIGAFQERFPCQK